MRWLPVVVLVGILASGCTLPGTGSDGGSPIVGGLPTPSTPGEDPRFPPLRFAGRVVDALSGDGLDDAEIALDLAATQPCQREGIVWKQSPIAMLGLEGRFGPFQIARPRTNDFAFFLHVSAPGYAENVTYVGPAEAQRDLGNLTVVLHPDRAITGTAPPGTVVALDGPRFPRLAAADQNGTFVIPHARVLEAAFVADTDDPLLDVVAAPANLTIPASEGAGWRLQGSLRGPGGAPLSADLVVRNATGVLVGAGRSNDDGIWSLAVPRVVGDYQLQARTPDGHWGAASPVNLTGQPATRFALVARALC